MLKQIRSNETLCRILRDDFDVDVLPELAEPEDEFGHLTYNIQGKTFARDGSGSEFILLEDESVGFLGSEGQCGRLADSISDFFALIVNCPWWTDVVNFTLFSDLFERDETLREYLKELQTEAGYASLDTKRQVGMELGITVEVDPVNVVKRFYACANREPRFVSTYTEDDGSKHDSTGSLFES